jgi:hypothetical protein
MMRGLLPLSPLVTMNAAAPDGVPPRRIGDKKFNKNSLPAVPLRGPEEEVLRIENDFFSSGVNSIGSCPFLKSCFFKPYQYKKNNFYGVISKKVKQ